MKNKIYIKLIMLFMSFFILNFSFVNALSLTSDSSVKVTTKNIKVDTPELKCNLKIPRIQTNDDSALSNSINDEILSFAENLKEKFETDSKEYVESATKQGYPIRPYVLSSEYHVPYNKNNMLSIKNVFYEYTAGAHGYYYFRTYTLDFNSGKKLLLKDLFPKDYDYNSVITNEIINQISLHTELYFPEYIESATKLPVTYNFFIEPGYLVVYYDLYEISPYASGIPEFKIPISIFGENINFKI